MDIFTLSFWLVKRSLDQSNAFWWLIISDRSFMSVWNARLQNVETLFLFLTYRIISHLWRLGLVIFMADQRAIEVSQS